MNVSIFTTRRNGFFLISLLLTMWSLNAARVEFTVLPADFRGDYIISENGISNYTRTTPPAPQAWQPPEGTTLSAANRKLREWMIALDRASYSPVDRGRTLSWVVFVIFPGLAAMAAFAWGLTSKSKPPHIIGMIRWHPKYYDPLAPGALPLSQLFDVTVNRVETAGPQTGHYKTLKPMTQAQLKSAYVDTEYHQFYAVPFHASDLPLNERLEISCTISNDFPAKDVLPQERILASFSARHSSCQSPEFTLTRTQPSLSGFIFELSPAHSK